MVFRKKLSFAVLLVFPLSALILPSEMLVFSYIERFYGGYDGTEGEVEMTLGYRFYGGTSKRVKETLFIRNMSGAVFYSESSEIHTLEASYQYNHTFTVPTGNLKTEGVLDLFYRIIDVETGNTLREKEAMIYKKTREAITISETEQRTFTYNRTYFSLNGSDANYCGYSEAFNLSGLSSYFASNTYYDLDLSNMSFLYNSPKSFKYSKATLSFQDKKNYFPYFSKDSRTKIMTINLKLIQSGSVIKMQIEPNRYYYDPLTYQMSNIERAGFLPTDRFYLPLKKQKLFEDTTFVLLVQRAGDNEVSFSIPITYNSSKSLFGSCSTSDYCISGGLDND